MKRFAQFLNEEKNVHMVHMEDLVILGGVKGVRSAINYLRSLRDMLEGNTSSSVNVTVKWDGCVHKDTVILTDNGDKTIHEIIEMYKSGENVKVMGRVLSPLSYDTYTEVIGESVSDGEKDWVEVIMEDGSPIILTEDHEIHTKNRGWVMAKDLNEKDDITEL